MNKKLKVITLATIILIMYVFLIYYNTTLEKREGTHLIRCPNGSWDEYNIHNKFFCDGEVFIYERTIWNITNKNISVEDLNITWQKIIK